MKSTSFIPSKNLQIFKLDDLKKLKRPFVRAGISAGFPSPADDYLDSIDLNSELIKDKEATFFAKVKGNSMIDAGINDGDILIINKALEPTNGKIAVCFIDGEFTVKRVQIEKEIVWLIPANPEFEPIKATPQNELIIWGIVTNIIKYV